MAAKSKLHRSKSSRKIRNALRKAIRKRLKADGLSGAAAAKKLGINAAAVANIVNNRRKRQFTIDELITLLGRTDARVAVKIKKKKKKKPGRKKVAKKKTAKRATKKKVAKKKIAKRATKKKTAKRATRRKTAKRATKKKTAKRATRKKAARKKVGKKKARKKATRKKAARRKTARAAASRKDNLQRIKGVGPSVERTLNRLGVKTYRQIAAFKPADVKRIAKALGTFGGRVTRDRWVQQATTLAAGRDTAFSRRVDKGKVASSRRK